MSVNRIDARFQQLRTEGRAGFIAYICGGDPSLQATRDLVIAFDKAGVDLVEIGVPFSDPLADGVVNQMASTRALAAAMPQGWGVLLFSEGRTHSRNEAPLGETLPIFEAPGAFSVNQRLPSTPYVIESGWALLVGTGNSAIVALNVSSPIWSAASSVKYRAVALETMF